MTVTEKSMRPASGKRRCFYCHEPIGGQHRPDCVLVKKRVRIRMTVEYDVEVPNHWDKHKIEFHRNDGSWCADNAITELEAVAATAREGCLCGCTHFEYLGHDSEPFLSE